MNNTAPSEECSYCARLGGRMRIEGGTEGMTWVGASAGCKQIGWVAEDYFVVAGTFLKR